MFRIEGYGPRASTNGAFLLAFVTTPIDSAHSMHYACTAAGLVLSAHAHNTEYYGLVKVVNNASGTRLAGSYLQTGIQSPTVIQNTKPHLST